ncbi:MAG: sigma 54-dependent Fis family transcriptional regulator, partial [Polyangiaceae bacterium]|nr:sigma 54-dependent Fis family transcriptional regulator [Polyangiaceae bacterium]
MTDRDADATLSLSDAGAAGALGAVVRVEGAHAEPKELALSRGTYIVGSGEDCALRIDDRTVSRRHVELSACAEGVRIRDLGSRNGTFYLGQRIDDFTAVFGARLTLGNVTLSIDVDRRSLEEAPIYDGDEYRGMYGTSQPMRRLFATLTRLETSLVTVLVEGESGTGKELVARAIHEGSPVASGPLVAVNCGAIARELIASELFGHKKGAFTHAVDARRGAFESADGGTLFLDEIGELPLDVQPTLLRALESGEIRPVGGDDVRRVRVRVVAATNRDLEDEVQRGRFRQDLYFRLAVVRLRVPPLRERPSDFAELTRRLAAELGVPPPPVEVLGELAGRAFPGNVRELKNAVAAYGALGVLPPSGRAESPLLDVALAQLVDAGGSYAVQKDA